jgi:hypothetical protein
MTRDGTSREGTRRDGVFLPAPSPVAARVYVVGVVLLMVAGFGIRFDALLTGFVADDYAQIGMLEGDYLVERSPLNLFNFSDGSVEEGQTLMRGGFYPWWTDPRVRLSMLRPLACLMMWLDWEVFGDNPLGAHLHSLAWWLAMLTAVAVLFRRLLPVPIALLSFALFVFDEAHGVTLSWIANRSALVSTALSVPALLLYLRFREGGARRDLWLSVGIVAVAFGFGEYTLCTLAFFFAYEVMVARDPLVQRARALLPVAAVGLAYLVLRPLLGHGPRHSGVYVGPGDPARFLEALVQRVPVMFADLTLALRAEYWTFGLPWAPAFVQQGWVGKEWIWSPEPWRAVHAWIGLGCMAALALIFVTLPRDGDARNARWLALGGALAVPPVVGSFPSTRLLMVALLGFTPLLTTFCVCSVRRLRSGERPRYVSGWGTHTEVSGLRMTSDAVRRTVLTLPVQDAQLPEQRIVMLTAREGGTSMYIPLTRIRHGLSAPKKCWTLSLTPAPMLLERDAPNAFTLTVTQGFTMLATAQEQLLRPTSSPPQVGARVDLGGMQVTVEKLLRGLPSRIHVRFDAPLEDPSLLFMIPTPDGVERFAMPEVGGRAIVPAPVIPFL